MKNHLIRIVAFCLPVWALLSGCQPKEETASKDTRPNIVFIMSDDHAYQAVSAYGFGLNETPNIDRIGREGVVFENAFVPVASCSPCRASLAT